MLLSLKRHATIFCRRSCSFSTVQSPSSKTTVILRKLPLSVTATSLKEALAEVNARKIELEPGFNAHFSNEAAAEMAAGIIEDKFGCQVSKHVISS